MSAAPGTRLGPYEITAKLGEGGMGEVFRARDTKLERDVAIKVLPAAFVEDSERLQRFEREAKLLAQLNHPNIAHIYGLEASGNAHALVMELVDGPTLAERLEPGPLPLDEALHLARQIAEALEEAHEKGIVHRDLKPQNIKASSDGKVKVLDFGLAKAMDPAASSLSGAGGELLRSPTLMQSPTLTAAHGTQLGVILGTAAYMAPEQARGGSVDKRADIWAFGVVLYEMLAGRSLFAGDTVSDTLAGVLKTEIDFTKLPAETPAAIRRLLRRCLERNPKNRLHDIADARLVVADVLAGSAGDDAAPATAGEAAPRAFGRWTLPAAAATLVIGAALGALLLAPKPAPPAALRLELALPAPLELGSLRDQIAVAISPDGRRLAAVVRGEDEKTRIVVRDLGALESRVLEGTEDGRNPIFSPDGEWIAYFTFSEVRKIAVTGGRSIRVAETDLSSLRGGVWGRDGYIYLAPNFATGIFRVPESGGEIESVTRLDEKRGDRTHRYPTLTPDGRALVYTADDASSPTYYDDARIEAWELATGARHVLVEGASQARFLGDDLLVYANGSNLFALRFDPERLAIEGKPVALEQEVRTNSQSGNTQFAVAESGATIWSTGSAERQRVSPRWYGLDGAERELPIPGGDRVNGIDLSPDGRRLAYRVGQGGSEARGDLWVLDLEQGRELRLTFDETPGVPTWSPDGRRVAYRRPVDRAQPDGEEEIVWRSADGGGEAELLVRPGGKCQANAFSPDGRLFVFSFFGKESRGSDLWLLPVGRPEEARPWADTPENETAAAISPDGRWIAYQSLGVTDPRVLVRPFPQGTGLWQVGLGDAPHWSRDSRELFFHGHRALHRVPIEPGASFAFGRVERLFDVAVRIGNPRTWAVDAVHRRFAVLKTESASSDSEAKLRVLAYATDWKARAEDLLARQR